ncbi:hypothetical protein pdam_00003002 [Pocillopora damicornis]|uniref:Uridylate-specific endoribonuclease n=2 Tax=Pocillopora damicornis TaxID=46731 RepID=A0A3M6U865_POCDA|nr:hypothetical protein pdam_00003002 [Pocillopora damicornis]
MWNNAGNNLDIPTELTVNAVNNANPLFTVVQGGGGVAKLASNVFTRFEEILVDYQAVPFVLNQQHINNFITEVTQPGGPMEAALNYLLTQHGSLPAGVTTLPQFRCVLEDLWFRNTNGFRDVFVGHKVNANDYNGFHNWYQFFLEQGRNPTQTTNICFKQSPELPAFVGNKRPQFLRDLSFTWRGATKAPAGSSSSMFVGTSPSFELALFTTCFLKGRGNAGGANPPPGQNRITNCDCTINEPNIGVSTVEVRTVENQNGEVVAAAPTNVH